ncbi:MAG: hypothetical protein O3A20_05120 [Planctomycetota bacterium]|nr:hypothetical protein [Planctomycetota bacterium]
MTVDTFGSILGAVYRRRGSVILVLLGAIGGGTLYRAKVKPEYLSSASVMIPNNPPTANLSSEAGNLPNGPLLPDMSDEVRTGAIGLFNSGAVADRMMQKRPDLDSRALKRNLKGNIDRNGNVQVLSYAPTPEQAAELANQYAECFQEEMEDVATAHMNRTFEAMSREEPIALAAYSTLHRGLVNYLGSIGSANLDQELARLLEDRKTIEAQSLDLDLARVRSEAERPVLQRALDERPEFALSRTTYGRNPAYEDALRRTRELSTQLALARLEYRDDDPDFKHPQLERLKAELDFVRSSALDLVEEQMVLQATSEAPDELARRLAARLAEMDIAGASFEAQREVLRLRSEAVDARLAVLPRYQSEVAIRMVELGNARQYWERISQRRAELDFHLRAGLHFTVMSPAMRARPEQAKVVPSVGGLYLFCVIAGLAGGLLFAVTSEMVARMRATRPY